MDFIIIGLLILLICLFGCTLYRYEQSRISEKKSRIKIVESRDNVVSISDPLVERLKSNIELFLEMENALIRDDSLEYLTLKSMAINQANKILGIKKEAIAKKG